MLEEKRNIWEVYGKYPICITINGYVRNNGRAVMGRGVSAQAARRIENLPTILGTSIQEHGNVVRQVVPMVLSFPVKPCYGVCSHHGGNVVPHVRKRYNPGDHVPGWAMHADPEIIKRSLWELSFWHDYLHDDATVYLPRPGCGAGRLNWERDVRPLCEVFDDWLVVVHI